MEDLLARIAVDPNVAHGKPVVRGTRVPVEVVLGAVAGGDPLTQVAEDYGIAEIDVRACVAFAASEISHSTYRAVSA